MAYDINTALERLEQNLKELDSARVQVEKTVNASDELQTVVKGYVTQVKELCEAMKSWSVSLSDKEGELAEDIANAIYRLSSSCDDIVENLKSNVHNTSNDFKSKTDSTLNEFNDQNVRLSEKVKELTLLHDEIIKSTATISAIMASLDQLSAYLKESQDKQNVVIEGIDKNLKAIPAAIESKGNENVEKINNWNSALNSNTIQYISSLLARIAGIETNISNLISTCQTIKTDTDSLKNELVSVKNEIKKSININRGIIIAGIVIIVALQIIMQILK